MILRVFTALLIAGGLALNAAYKMYVPVDERRSDTEYYDFGMVFLWNLPQLLFFFLMVCVPVSVCVDHVVYVKFRNRSFLFQQGMKAIFYAVAGIVVGYPLTFIMGIPERRLGFLLACAAGFILFGAIHLLLKTVLKIILRPFVPNRQ